jgi:hypothetical protein
VGPGVGAASIADLDRALAGIERLMLDTSALIAFHIIPQFCWV